MAVYRLSVDYTLADQVVGPSGKVAFVPTVRLGDATGAAFGTVGNPIFISGGGGGAITIADGADIAEGAKADAAYAGSGSASVVALLKGNYNALVAATPAGANVIGKVGIDQTTTGTTNLVTIGSTSGFVFSGIATPAVGLSNSNLNALRTASFGYVFNGLGWDMLVKPNANARLLSSAATTNATSVKASPGNVFKIVGNNTVASKRYLKLYNKASAPTVGTDTPLETIVILASASFDFSFTAGMYFSTGIAFAITGAAADADTTTIGAGDIECLNISYA